MQLNKSQVIFDSEAHTYQLNGVPLSGITEMIGKSLFPDKYKDIPDYILNNAADRGTMVHESCELVDDLGIEPNSPESANYITLKEENGLKYECSEYLVSDNEHFASCIDKVYRVDDNTFDLADIKTTYKLDLEYVRWQLSIYAYLFEMQNPDCKVGKLYAIWLRKDECRLAEVERIDKEQVISLMACWISGLPFERETYSLPQKYLDMESEIKNIIEQAKYWDDKKKELAGGIMAEMVKAGVYDWKGKEIKITRKKDSIRKDFDKKRFEGDNPDLYASYLKETPVMGSVTLKI